MLYLPISVPKSWWGKYDTKICGRVGEIRGTHPWDGHTNWNLCQEWVWVMKVEVGGKAPLWNILTNKRICVIMPP